MSIDRHNSEKKYQKIFNMGHGVVMYSYLYTMDLKQI